MGASAAAANGVDARLICKHGGWAQGSKVVDTYIDEALLNVLEVGAAVLDNDTPTLVFESKEALSRNRKVNKLAGVSARGQ